MAGADHRSRRRVSSDLIVNDEAEISEVVRRRLFQDLGESRIRGRVAGAYADWCFERRAQLPPEWTSVDSATTDKQAKELLRERFERRYPFHPATLSVFQRKWQSLAQYQQTRGTLAMLGQWVSEAYREGFLGAGNEPLIALGSAPLRMPTFRSTVLGQLGEPRLLPAIEADIAGDTAHARALDADTKGVLRGIHQRVATAIFFESSGGQQDKVAHLPELRYALGEPGIDTTSIDNAAAALDGRAFYVRRIGSDGYKIGHKAKLSKVVADRRAALDPEEEIPGTVREIVGKEFGTAATLPMVRFPRDASEISDLPRLTTVVADPEWEWAASGEVRDRVAEWTRARGLSDRLYPGSLVWCIRRPGRDLREAVELMLAWQRVEREIKEGTLGGDYEATDLADIRQNVRTAESNAKDEVWAGYRFVAVWDPNEAGDLKVIRSGAGHASAAESLTGRIVTALKAEGLLSDSVGAGYLERHWPAAFEATGAWPLVSLRQAFLNGTLTRLTDPDRVLKAKIVEFVAGGELGLASGRAPDGTFNLVWFDEPVSPDEVTFDPEVYLLTKRAAGAAKAGTAAIELEPIGGEQPPSGQPEGGPSGAGHPEAGGGEGEPSASTERRRIRLTGVVPPEMWNRLGTRVVARLRSASDVQIRVEAAASADEADARRLEQDLRTALSELGLEEGWELEES